MALATITSKGQITIPKAVRERLKVGTGDKIEFILINNTTWVRFWVDFYVF